MRVHISSKANNESRVYELESRERERLSMDWTNFLTEGSPRKGFYNYYTDIEHRQQKHLYLNFEGIATID